MGTEELLIRRIESDLRKLKNKKAEVKDLQIKARLKRLEVVNKPMAEDLTQQLENLITPIFKINPDNQITQNTIKFNSLFKN